ncbi:MAG: DegV family protein [Clostridiaceae bacterium]
MEKIKLITDSTSDLTQELIEKYDIDVLPLNVHLGDKTYKDGESITLEEMYEGIRNGGPFPTTSQVNPQDFYDVYKKYLAEGYKIISTHVSTELSGTLQSAKIAKDMLETEDITIIDSTGVSGTIFLPLIEAGEMIKAGKSFDEVVKAIQENSKKVKVLVSFDTLENLVKGGRVPKSVGTIGNLLGIKPLISIKEGKLEMVDKVRGRKKALKSMIEFINNMKIKEGSKILMINSINDEMRSAIGDHIKSLGLDYYDVKVGCVLGVHAGPGLVGIFNLEP